MPAHSSHDNYINNFSEVEYCAQPKVSIWLGQGKGRVGYNVIIIITRLGLT